MKTETRERIKAAAQEIGDTVLESGHGYNIIEMSDNVAWITFDTEINMTTARLARVMTRAAELGYQGLKEIEVGPRYTHFVVLKRRW